MNWMNFFDWVLVSAGSIALLSGAAVFLVKHCGVRCPDADPCCCLNGCLEAEGIDGLIGRLSCHDVRNIKEESPDVEAKVHGNPYRYEAAFQLLILPFYMAFSASPPPGIGENGANWLSLGMVMISVARYKLCDTHWDDNPPQVLWKLLHREIGFTSAADFALVFIRSIITFCTIAPFGEPEDSNSSEFLVFKCSLFCDNIVFFIISVFRMRCKMHITVWNDNNDIETGNDSDYHNDKSNQYKIWQSTIASKMTITKTYTCTCDMKQRLQSTSDIIWPCDMKQCLQSTSDIIWPCKSKENQKCRCLAVCSRLCSAIRALGLEKKLRKVCNCFDLAIVIVLAIFGFLPCVVFWTNHKQTEEGGLLHPDGRQRGDYATVAALDSTTMTLRRSTSVQTSGNGTPSCITVTRDNTILNPYKVDSLFNLSLLPVLFVFTADGYSIPLRVLSTVAVGTTLILQRVLDGKWEQKPDKVVPESKARKQLGFTAFVEAVLKTVKLLVFFVVIIYYIVEVKEKKPVKQAIAFLKVLSFDHLCSNVLLSIVRLLGISYKSEVSTMGDSPPKIPLIVKTSIISENITVEAGQEVTVTKRDDSAPHPTFNDQNLDDISASSIDHDGQGSPNGITELSSDGISENITEGAGVNDQNLDDISASSIDHDGQGSPNGITELSSDGISENITEGAGVNDQNLDDISASSIDHDGQGSPNGITELSSDDTWSHGDRSAPGLTG